MLTPELKRLSYDSSPPDDPENCCVQMVVTIGTKGTDAGDYFYFDVVTPKYLLRNWPLWGRHTLVVDSFNIEVIERTVSVLLEGINGASWHEIAGNLCHYMEWEFHDYSTQGQTGNPRN